MDTNTGVTCTVSPAASTFMDGGGAITVNCGMGMRYIWRASTSTWEPIGTTITNISGLSGPTSANTASTFVSRDASARSQFADPAAAQDAATKSYVDKLTSPTGAMIMYGGASAPTGWLLCDGSAVSRTTYANLFSAIGTAYGVGDGSTTFNLPNLVSKFARGGTPGTGGGADTHTHTSAAHSHTLSDPTSYAKIITTGTHVYNVRGTTAGIMTSGEVDYNVSTAVITAGVSASAAGTQLGGATDSTTPGTTGSSSNIPAYTNVNYIIKT